MDLNAPNKPDLQAQEPLLFEELSEQEQEAVAGGFNLFSFDFDDLNLTIPNGTFTISPFSGSLTSGDQTYTLGLTEGATVTLDDGTLTGTGGTFTITST